MSFRSRFPAVAALLASTGLAAQAPAIEPNPPENDGDDEDQGGGDGGAAAGGAKRIDQAALQRAFERDAGKLVQDERARWNAVLESNEGKANAGMARRLLNKTAMSADEIIETLQDEDAGKPAGQAPQRERVSSARERLRGDRAVDRDTGGAGGSERAATGGRDELEERRERRREMQDRRNARVEGRGARRGGDDREERRGGARTR